jgi:hypothetical protein
VLWLLAQAVRSSDTRRVYLVFPLLILWGNLHGSVTIGVGLAVVYGATLLIEDLRTARRRGTLPLPRRRTVAFLVAPVLCLFVTPYGTSIVGYYHETLLNPAFSQLVTEWRPVTSTFVLAAPFFVLAFATIWLLGRAGARAPLFDQFALIALAIGALLAVRNITWFGLAVVILLPNVIGRVLPSRGVPRRRPALNLSLAGLSLAVVAGAVIAVAVKPSSWFERRYDQRTLAVVAASLKQHPDVRIYADVRFGDWLLWHNPALAGHIAYDIRFELLTDRQLRAIAGVTQISGAHQPDLLAPYGLLVLDSKHKAATQRLLDGRGAHLRLRGKGVVVATTSAL